AASAKNGRNESLTPSRASKAAFARSRSRVIAVTSASTTVVSWAEVCSDSTMRRAMSCPARDLRSAGPPGAAGTRARGGGGGARGRCLGWGGRGGHGLPGGGRGRLRCGGRLLLAQDPGGLEHVLLADPTADAGARHRGEVHAVFCRELAHERGDVRAFGGGRYRGSGRCRRGHRRGRRRGGRWGQRRLPHLGRGRDPPGGPRVWSVRGGGGGGSAGLG